MAQPRATTEQYATPASIAAEAIYFAHGKRDIAARSVVDLGCGNGVLAIAARILGATRVVGIDSDPAALETARENAARAKVDVEWRLGDVGALREPFETVVMNPPFGAQRRGADRPFLATAMACGRSVYVFLNAKAEGFVRRRIEGGDGRITDRVVYRFPIPHTFEFHREAVRRVEVVFYRFEVAKG